MITIPFLVVALIVHLVVDYHKHAKQTPIEHWQSALYVVGVSAIMGLLNFAVTGISIYLFVIASLGIHFALFDFIWNFANHKPMFYHGLVTSDTSSLMDRFWSRVPPAGEVLFKVIILYGALEVYYNWSLIYNGILTN